MTQASELKVTQPQDYAAIVEEKADAGELVKMPSGAVFRLRRVDLEELTLMGELPQSLVNEGLHAWREQGTMPAKDEETQAELPDAEDTIKNLIFLRQTVVENCLEPRIGYSEVGVVSLLDSSGKAIAKLKKKDFLHAFRWITSQEGVEAGGLNTFRNRQERRAATSSSNRKKLQRAPVGAARG